jgi:hypothetical protein
LEPKKNERVLIFFSFLAIATTMSSAEVQVPAVAADNALGKRKAEEEAEGSDAAKLPKTAEESSPASELPLKDAFATKDGAVVPKARENRLDQNRKAAKESRRRKKVMIEELQRSVIFFSRANGALKQQNDDLTRLLMQAQMQVASADKKPEETPAPVEEKKPAEAPAPTATEVKETAEALTKANTVATQAIFESQGFPAAAARAAAQAVNGSVAEKPVAPVPALTSTSLPPMQPGATMQAMANFQQAAAAAMQQAMGQMKGVPGLTQMAATPIGGNPQHAFTDGKCHDVAGLANAISPVQGSHTSLRS